MKVSLNWVKQFTGVSLAVDELVEKIGIQLGAVDDVINVGEKYKDALVVKVVSSVKHPNADKLSLCLVDDGKTAKKVARDKDGFVQVVCGAPNVAAGQLVVWLPPGATVPSSFDKDPFILEAREIRGIVSNGMIASARELAIGDDHTGIVVIEDVIRPGTLFAQAYQLDDYVIDIENKMFTHRPDLFGMIGVAREITGITHKAFKSPSWYVEGAEVHSDGRKNVLSLEVANELPELVKRFCAIAIKDIRVKPSPLWLSTYLSRIGVRPINNIVDITNYLMLETGQPLHAYDYDKVKNGAKTATLGVRGAKAGEELTLLGGKRIKLQKDTIVITDGKRPIGLGGVMGGADTEVDDSTRNIILEVANFEMNATRRTAMDYGLFTDAATRFTKGQSPRQNRAVISRAVGEIRKVAGGRLASELIDKKNLESAARAISVSIGFVNSRLGLKLTGNEMKRLLQNVEFNVEATGDNLEIKYPFWRTDIEIAEDIVEEIGRLYGYDHLPLVLPTRSISPTRVDPTLELKAEIRGYLADAGANEALSYSFVHESLLKRVGQDPEQAFHIHNALSPELQYYRLSVLPSLLEKVHPNIKLGFDEFALFEMNKSHNKLRNDQDEPSLPSESHSLALVVAGRDKTHKDAGSPYYLARTYLDYLAARLGIELEYEQIKKEPPAQPAKPFNLERSAHVYVKGSKDILGIVGEFRPSAYVDFKLPVFCSGFEISLKQLGSSARAETYHPLNRFPATEQDLCLRYATDLTYKELEDYLRKSLNNLAKTGGYIYELTPLDSFQKLEDKRHVQTTWHIELAHPARTLTSEEVNKAFDKIAIDAKKQLNAERI